MCWTLRWFAFLLLLASTSPVAAQGIDCATYGNETLVSEQTGRTSRDASLVWTGSGYGVAWTDYRDSNPQVYFARLDADGTKIGPDVRVTTDPASSYGPSLVWTGSGYGVTWSDYRGGGWEVYFARLDLSGAVVGQEIRISFATRAQDPSLVWTGTEFGIAWENKVSSTYRIYFERRDTSGNQLGGTSEVSHTSSASKTDPSLVWTGSEYGLAYGCSTPRTVYFTRMNEFGGQVIDPLAITTPVGSPRYPSLTWTGSGYGVAYSANRNGSYETWITRLDAAGNVVGEDVEVVNNTANSLHPSLAWSDTEFGLAWADNEGGRNEIFFTNLDPSGNDVADDVRLTHDFGFDGYPSLVRADGVYGLAWQDDRYSGSIYFSRIICGCQTGADPDEDGVGMPCDNCPATPNADQVDIDRDGAGDACDACVDCDHDGFGDPGYPHNLCLLDNCPDHYNPEQVDIDGDLWGNVCDCHDENPAINPGHPEYNDNLDNDCDGAIDEGSSRAIFCCDGEEPPSCITRFCWPGQVGATMYQAARSDARWFGTGCTWIYTTQVHWDDPAVPDSGECYYYLHRPTEPLEGSWGMTNYWPHERDMDCVP